ncbi:MAG: hypothetical protein KIS76_01755 [Pyrinomonadaceae bacterium]|nr:hypothetical protein [Pyrinomonadaceae bacterium]
MVAKLTVIFFIALCLMVGIFLTLLPWTNFGGLVEWSDNYFLNLIVRTTGLASIKSVVASGWFRGAVTGLGVLNLMLAFWELAHFDKSVKTVEEGDARLRAENLKTN